jgi:hypothetical protein
MNGMRGRSVVLSPLDCELIHYSDCLTGGIEFAIALVRSLVATIRTFVGERAAARTIGM